MLRLFQVKLDHPDMSKADTQKLPSFQSAVLRKTCQFRTLNRRWCKPTHCCKKRNALQMLTCEAFFFGSRLRLSRASTALSCCSGYPPSPLTGRRII